MTELSSIINPKNCERAAYAQRVAGNVQLTSLNLHRVLRETETQLRHPVRRRHGVQSTFRGLGSQRLRGRQWNDLDAASRQARGRRRFLHFMVLYILYRKTLLFILYLTRVPCTAPPGPKWRVVTGTLPSTCAPRPALR